MSAPLWLAFGLTKWKIIWFDCYQALLPVTFCCLDLSEELILSITQDTTTSTTPKPTTEKKELSAADLVQVNWALFIKRRGSSLYLKFLKGCWNCHMFLSLLAGIWWSLACVPWILGYMWCLINLLKGTQSLETRVHKTNLTRSKIIATVQNSYL